MKYDQDAGETRKANRAIALAGGLALTGCLTGSLLLTLTPNTGQK